MAVMLVKRGRSHQQIINEEWILYASVRIVNVKTGAIKYDRVVFQI